MNFNLNPGMVRGDLFKESGKWAYTVQIDMSKSYNGGLLHNVIVAAARSTPSNISGVGEGAFGPNSPYTLVVLDPYHEFAHPQMIRLKDHP